MIKFGPWLPDLPDFENPGALEALNCVPLPGESYGPWNALQEVGDALTARCQGAFSYRGVGGTIFVTAGDATKLYKWSGSGWTDVSRTVGGAYAVATEDMIAQTLFGDLVISVNGTDAPQKWTIGSSSNYAALGGSPPVGRFVVTVNNFVVIGRIASAKNRIRWSAINDAEAWTVGVNQSDEQDLPEGGQVMGMVGGEYGTVWVERSIYRMTYVGSPVVFQIDRIAENIGCCAENSIAAHGKIAFFLDWSGFYMMSPEGYRPIGDQKVDKYFWSRVNQSFLYRVQGFVDPINQRYIVIYPSTSSSDGTPDSVLFYAWTLDRWSRAEQSMDYLFRFLSGTSYHTDNIDTVIGNTDATSFLVDSNQFLGTGAAKLAAFSTGKKLATFEGSALQATIDTTEAQVTPGRQTFIREIWPYVDGGTTTVALGTRDTPQGGINWSNDTAVNSVGFAPFRSRARYHRARVKVSGGLWEHAQGVLPVGQQEGRY